MAKRDSGHTQAKGGTAASDIEKRVVAFAEQLGRIAGSVQAKAESWIDREALNTQIASVRDGAIELLDQLADAANASRKSTVTAARKGAKGRSGGVVDAPGKKHRKPAPGDPGANLADSQAAKMRAAKTMVKTNRRRGRG
jgi:hypothetical protein